MFNRQETSTFWQQIDAQIIAMETVSAQSQDALANKGGMVMRAISKTALTLFAMLILIPLRFNTVLIVVRTVNVIQMQLSVNVKNLMGRPIISMARIVLSEDVKTTAEMNLREIQSVNAFKTFHSHIANVLKRTREVEMIAQKFSVLTIVQIMEFVTKKVSVNVKRLSMEKIAV
jgi:hypothetical protein